MPRTAVADAAPEVQCIHTLQEFESLRRHWQQVYDSDPHANLFVAWHWLRGWIGTSRRGWMALTASAQPGSSPDAFVFLSYHRAPHWYRIDRPNILRLGAHPTADCTGFVCRPGCERLLGDLAQYVAHHISWDQLSLGEVCDPRLNLWLREFEDNAFHVRRLPSTPCPEIELPASWDEYLSACVSPATRKTLRRRLRAVESMQDVHWTDIDATNARQHIDLLLNLWRERWPATASAIEMERLRGICMESFRAGQLWLRVLWRNDTPMAAISGFIDERACRFCGYLMGINNAERDSSPGTVLMAHSIQFSIQRGLRYFDFLRGNEAYKYSLGARDRFNQNILLTRVRLTTTARIAAGKIALRTRTRSLMHRLRLLAIG